MRDSFIEAMNKTLKEAFGSQEIIIDDRVTFHRLGDIVEKKITDRIKTYTKEFPRKDGKHLGADLERVNEIHQTFEQAFQQAIVDGGGMGGIEAIAIMVELQPFGVNRELEANKIVRQMQVTMKEVVTQPDIMEVGLQNRALEIIRDLVKYRKAHNLPTNKTVTFELRAFVDGVEVRRPVDNKGVPV
jgi:hypothetical protein